MLYPFSKLNGLGNSFVLMNDLNGKISAGVDIHRFAQMVCDVNFGIGADGLILVQSSGRFDFRMRIYNEDGSEAEMCGNGIRCMVRFLAEEGICDKSALVIETLAGPVATVQKAGNMIEVDMGYPVFFNDDVVANETDGLLQVQAADTTFHFVSMGNPHAITFVDSFDFDWRKLGAEVENETSIFPHRTNVEFGRVENEGEMTMKVWERGCGETQACGTGTCALVVAAVHTNRVQEGDVLVHLPGGDLFINYSRGNSVRMTGPAKMVCQGNYIF
ncbi:MAG: diaminopimelate epimerase [Deltaproteobacteria bacterium]|nr:diaminopimelate epimerase [Deltaproteobacteria bacterium]